MKQAELGGMTDEGRKRLRELVGLPTLREMEDSYSRRVIQLCGGDLTLAAKVLGVGRATLYRRAKALAGELEQPSTAETKAARVARREAAIRKEFAVRGAKL